MHLNWSETWTHDIFEHSTEVLNVCESRLKLLSPQERERSGQVLANVRRQLADEQESIRRGPHIWGTQLANVGIRLVRRLSSESEAERVVARNLANFCGIVYNYRRRASGNEYENLFRDSLEAFLLASLPDMVPSIIAADILEQVREWTRQFYETTPKDLFFKLNDIILNGYETHRKSLDTGATHGLMLKFIEDNQDVISMPVSDSSEWIRKKWEDLYRNHLGEPPKADTRVISADVRAKLKEAVDANDPLMVRDVLAPIEEPLRRAVLKALDSSFEFREPRRVVRDSSHKTAADFEAARRQIRSHSKKAVASF